MDSPVVILATVGYYLPGFKAGGPLRSIDNMSKQLGGEYRFHIIAYDRDLGDSVPYSGIRIGDWNDLGDAKIYYFPSGGWSLRNIYKVLSSAEFDVLYLNSYFSPQFTVLPLLLRRFGLIPDTPVIVAPRGEFSSGALEIKIFKKKMYILLARILGLYKGVLWHASSPFEKNDIGKVIGEETEIHVAMNIAGHIANAQDPRDAFGPTNDKHPGKIRLVFLSRLNRMKNLEGALRMLEGMRAEIHFDIYGPVEDPPYWEMCKNIIAGLPENVHVEHKGSVPHEQVSQVLSKYHFLYLPTQGENFGHVIFEALSSGLPVIISDRTPWRRLSERGVGWDLPLSRPEEFRSVLRQCLEMGGEEYGRMSGNAVRFAHDGEKMRTAVEENRELFRKAVDPSRGREANRS